MEPFGLLNFLKTLLPTEVTPSQPTPENKEETTAKKNPLEEEKENAYLLFIEAHEKRAKRK
jgi:hypothetical protein